MIQKNYWIDRSGPEVFVGLYKINKGHPLCATFYNVYVKQGK